MSWLRPDIPVAVTYELRYSIKQSGSVRIYIKDTKPSFKLGEGKKNNKRSPAAG